MISQIVDRVEGLYGRIVGRHQAEMAFYRIGNRARDWEYGGTERLGTVPKEALDYLRSENPRLAELERRYAAVEGIEHSVWAWHTSAVRLHKFRGEGDFLSQGGADLAESYTASFGYALALDKEGLLDRLTEDSLFKCHTYEILGKPVSRDLLDSVLEIGFLADAIGWSNMSTARVLDIGAGYGRLAHRLVQSFPDARVWCTDGVPTSSFLAEFYLGFRKADRASILPLDEVASFVGPVDLACNIHSWSECTLQSIRWWLDRLDNLRPRYLFVVPHTEAGLAREKDNTKPSFLPEITNRGWRLAAKREKYFKSPLLSEKGVFPAWYFLFER